MDDFFLNKHKLCINRKIISFLKYKYNKDSISINPREIIKKKLSEISCLIKLKLS